MSITPDPDSFNQAGQAALVEAARLELARIYSRLCPEFEQPEPAHIGMAKLALVPVLAADVA